MDVQDINQILAELPGFIDCVEIAAFEAELAWSVVIDAETVLLLEHNKASGQILVSSEICALPREREAELLGLLFTANALGHDRGGIFFGRPVSDAAVEQFMWIAEAGLTAQRLAAVLSHFMSVREGWMQIIRSAPAQRAGDDEAIRTAIRA